MRRRSMLLLAIVLAASGGGFAWKYLQADRAVAASQPVVPAIPATVGIVERKDVPVYIDGLGTVQAFNTVTVNTRVDGTLEKVSFVEGQDVKAGDILAQIDPGPFQASLDLAVATKARDEALLANSRLDLKRFQDGGPLANTQQQLDTQAWLVRQLEATVKADQANIDAAQVQLDYTTVRSPLAGRTGIRIVDQGNIVHAASTTGLVVITQLQPISVIFTLPQDQLQEVLHQMGATSTPLQAVAQGRGSQQTLDTGTLALVDNQIDPTSGNVRLKATFPNPNHTLWPGQYVNIRLSLKTLQQVVTVPSTAIQRGPDGMFVYAIKPDSTIAIQPVTVAQMSQGTTVVDTGLSPGASIVVAGQYRLKPGSRVRNMPSDTHLASDK